MDQKKQYEDKLKNFLSSLNIYIATATLFFFIIFIPYATLIGNAVELRLKNAQELNYQESKCNFNIQDLSEKWVREHKYRDVKNIKKESINAEIKEIRERSKSLKFLPIGAIPASIGEIILLSSAIMSIYFFLIVLKLKELYFLKIKIDPSNNLSSISKIPYERIIFLVILSIFFYLYIIIKLNNFIIYNSCTLTEIIKSNLIYQQDISFYMFFHFISFCLSLGSFFLLISMNNKLS